MLGRRGWPGAPRQIWCAITAHPGGWCPGCSVLAAGVRGARRMASSRVWVRACPGVPGFAGVTGGACVVGIFRCPLSGGHVVRFGIRARVLDLIRVPGCLGCAGARGTEGIEVSSPVASSRVRMSGVCPVPGGGMSDPFRCVLDPSCIRRGFACRGFACRGVGRGGPGLPGLPGHTGTAHRERGPPGPDGWDVRGRLDRAGAGMWPRRPGCAQRARRLGLGREKMPLTQAR